MSRKKAAPRTPSMPTAFDQARDELFSHILRCGVLEAAPEHQKEWIDDTMQYLGDRYNNLTAEELTQVRTLGERFCQPLVKHPENVADADAVTDEIGEPEPEPETAEVPA